MVEFDIRRTADGFLVVHHDPAIRSKAGEIMLCSSRLKDIENAASEAGFALPTFQETLKHLHRRIPLLVELKETGYEAEALSMILQVYDIDEFWVQSFNASTVRTVKQIRPEVTAGFLMKSADDICTATHLPANFYAVNADLFNAQHDFFTQARQKRIGIAVWTVDNDTMLNHFLLAPEVDAIITNRTSRAVQLQRALT